MPMWQIAELVQYMNQQAREEKQAIETARKQRGGRR